MGCDIHMYVERKLRKNSDYWTPFGGRINPGRDYDMFGVLAGVRRDVEPLFPVRGLPEKIAYEADGDYWLFIVPDDREPQEGSANASDAAGWVQSGSVYRKGVAGDKLWVSHPDWHTHSWLNFSEFEKCVQAIPDANPSYRALVAAMRSLEKEDIETRIVFWFDN